jgi:SAM-dependent methyltransferase
MDSAATIHFLSEAIKPGARVLEIVCGRQRSSLRGLLKDENSNGKGSWQSYVLCDTDRSGPDSEAAGEIAGAVGVSVLEEDEFPFSEELVEMLLEQGSFDAILATDVLRQCTREQVLEAWRQFHRLLKTGGVLCLSCTSIHLDCIQAGVREVMQTAVKIFLDTCDQQANANIYLPGYIPRLHDALNTGAAPPFTAPGPDGHCFLPTKEVLVWLCDEKLHMGDQGLKSFDVEACDYRPAPEGNGASAEPKEGHRGGKETIALVAARTENAPPEIPPVKEEEESVKEGENVKEE